MTTQTPNNIHFNVLSNIIIAHMDTPDTYIRKYLDSNPDFAPDEANSVDYRLTIVAAKDISGYQLQINPAIDGVTQYTLTKTHEAV